MFIAKSSVALMMPLVFGFIIFSNKTYSRNFIGKWETKIEVGQHEQCQLWYEFYLDGSYFMYTNCNDNNVEEAVGKWHLIGSQLVLDWGVLHHYQTISDFTWKSTHSFHLKITYHPNPYYIGKERIFSAIKSPPSPLHPQICNACAGTSKIRCTHFGNFDDFNKCPQCNNKGNTPCTACGGDGYHN